MRDPNLIKDIVDLEDELNQVPYFQIHEEWVQDRVKTLRHYYELLLKEWPIIRKPDERTYHADTE